MDKKRFSIVIFIIGMVSLIIGTTILLINLLNTPASRDAEYLVEIGKWERADAPGVIWDFTEIGKGTLTTNNHLNNYDFSWSIDGGKISIKTSWLYELNDEYVYNINRQENLLTLSSDESVDIDFRPASSVNAEITEND